MSPIDELVGVMRDCPDVATRERLAAVVRKLRNPPKRVRVVNPQRITDAAVAAGRQARAAGKPKDGHQRAGCLQERNAWIAGWNDEDAKRGGV